MSSVKVAYASEDSMHQGDNVECFQPGKVLYPFVRSLTGKWSRRVLDSDANQSIRLHVYIFEVMI